MTTETKDKESKPRGRPVSSPRPQKVGDTDGKGFEVVGMKDNRVMLKSPAGRFGVYTDCWTKDESTLLRPSKDEALATSVLNTGKAAVTESPKDSAKNSSESSAPQPSK